MTNTWQRVHSFFRSGLWEADIHSGGRIRAVAIRSLRIGFVAVRAALDRQLDLRATGLVYTTLLSLVPLLAVSFSVLKAFGGHNLLAPLLSRLLAPLGPSAGDLTQSIVAFIDRTKVGVLGSLGVATLLVTVVLLIQKIEDALNYIWNIEQSRRLARAFSNYLSVILVGPLLVFTAMGITASVLSATVVQRMLSIEPFGTGIYIASRLSPYVLTSAAFTFLYTFLTNTKVRFRSALVGGVFAGVVWQLVGWGFAAFVARSSRYTAIYSGFAIVVLFMMWLYISWFIILAGAEVSFYDQYPHLAAAGRTRSSLLGRWRERVGFGIMLLIGRNFFENKPGWTFDALVDRLGVRPSALHGLVTILKERRLIVETADDPPALLPARDLGTIDLREILAAVRVEKQEACGLEPGSAVPEIDTLMRRVEGAAEEALGTETLKNLVLSCTDSLPANQEAGLVRDRPR